MIAARQPPRPRPIRRTAAALLILFTLSPGVAGEDSRIRNGSFGSWKDGRPEGWLVEIGARTGSGDRESRLEPLAGGGLRLSGDGDTQIWRVLRQDLDAKPRHAYVVEFGARVAGIRRERGQFYNKYVALAFHDASGERLDLRLADIAVEDWQPQRFHGVTPEGAASASVLIFLSLSGALEIKDLAVTEVPPKAEACYDLLVEDMARHYSYFKLRGIDWLALARRYRPGIRAARDGAAFARGIRPLLASLEDLHVSVELASGERIVPYSRPARPNYDFSRVFGLLEDPVRIGETGFTGRTAEGFGYVAIGSLPPDDAVFERFEAEIERLFDAPGFLVDLRGNAGGSEAQAARIAALFADEPRVYARSLVRSGPDPDDLVEAPERRIAPRSSGRTFRGPVICLIGPRCISSGEGFAMMMKAIPGVTLLGQPTRGSSGNPAPCPLPNGVTVHYSRWVSLLPDGTPIEDRGVLPDITVRHAGSGDPTYRRAIRELARRVTPRGS